jgi:hypothetical protein
MMIVADVLSEMILALKAVRSTVLLAVTAGQAFGALPMTPQMPLICVMTGEPSPAIWVLASKGDMACGGCMKLQFVVGLTPVRTLITLDSFAMRSLHMFPGLFTWNEAVFARCHYTPRHGFCSFKMHGMEDTIS